VYDGRAWVAADLLVRYRLPVHGAVLEIACGTRHWTAIVSAREEVTTVTALDASPEMIKIARVKAPDATFTCADIFEWTHHGRLLAEDRHRYPRRLLPRWLRPRLTLPPGRN
jgi:trans-aconitate methyltransferase